MSNVSILVVKPGTITPKNKKLLASMEVVIIETDDSESIKFIAPSFEISGADMLLASLAALVKADDIAGNRLFVGTLKQMMEQSGGA